MSAQVVLAEAERHIRERAAMAKRLGRLYEDEFHGLLYAIDKTQPVEWSKDPEKQERFLKGFNEGCEIMRVARGVVDDAAQREAR